ncbi:aminomethyl-transferring glycine dehydrogenase subunit GcvPB [Elusimicrobiota bacterium]
MEKTIFELSAEGKRGIRFPKADIKPSEKLPESYLRSKAPSLPRVTEPEVVRHFTRLSQMNFSVDTHFYPLGSCTMKHNPKANEWLANHPNVARIHPFTKPWAMQGMLSIIKELEDSLLEVTGMDALTLSPAAGAHSELAAIFVARSYFLDKGDNRTKVIIPDSAHGTNPSSAALGGFTVTSIKSNSRGKIDINELSKNLDSQTAVVMITLPNTLGLFEDDILEVNKLAHKHGALIYLDGANMNALMGILKPGELGFDLMHLNPHKTFSTPHGGGGPGAGVLLVKEHLRSFLPGDKVTEKKGVYDVAKAGGKSIGRVRSFFGSVAVLLRAANYILTMGSDGLAQVSREAIIKANYLKAMLKKAGLTPFIDEICMHECVFTIDPRELNGVRTLDIAKRLLDFGFHAPTVYFPLIAPEAIMVEPTETETYDTLDDFAKAIEAILHEAKTEPDRIKTSPHSLPVKRLNEVQAARNPILRAVGW